MVSKVLLGLILVLFDKKEYLIKIFYFVDLVVWFVLVGEY